MFFICWCLWCFHVPTSNYLWDMFCSENRIAKKCSDIWIAENSFLFARAPVQSSINVLCQTCGLLSSSVTYDQHVRINLTLTIKSFCAFIVYLVQFNVNFFWIGNHAQNCSEIDVGLKRWKESVTMTITSSARRLLLEMSMQDHHNQQSWKIWTLSDGKEEIWLQMRFSLRSEMLSKRN